MASVKQRRSLTGLPVELLSLIAEFLSPADTTCLALCNHRLFSVFAVSGLLKHRLSKGQPGDLTNERSLFLTRLSLDFPEYYLCSACLQLHLWRTFPVPAIFIPPECMISVASSGEYWLAQSIAYSYWPSICIYFFHFTHLQLAMRRFYHGPKYGISTDSLFYIEAGVSRCEDTTSPLQKAPASKPKNTASPGIKTYLISFDARIYPAAPSLCLRIQAWSVVNRQNVSALLPEKDYVWFCGHIKIEKPNTSDHVRWHISAYRSGSPRAAEYGKCSKCNTEWRIEVREFGAQDVSLILTSWIDLGPGLYPQDPRWRSRQRSSVDVPPEDIVASPRLRYETGLADGERNKFSDEELYSRNASLLKGWRYMDVMEKISGTRAWCLRPNSPKRRTYDCVVL